MINVTAHYKTTTVGADGRPFDLQACLQEIIGGAALPVQVDYHDGRVIECQNFSEHQGRSEIHLVTYKRNQATTLIKHNDNTIGPLQPPAQADFMRSNMAVVVDGSHLVFCGQNRASDSLLRILVLKLKTARGQKDDVRALTFHAAAKRDVVARIVENGVKKISAKMVAPAATVLGAREQRAGNLSVLFARLFRDPVYSADHDALKVSIDFIAGKRGINGSPLSLTAAEDVAKTFVEDPEAPEYTIELGNGDRITNTDVSVRKQLILNDFNETFEYDSAIENLRAFMRELRQQGEIVG